VNAALALAEPAAEARAILVTASPRGDEDVLYEADEERVRQVLLNLVTNAVKFTPPGGRVSIEHGMEGTRVYFRVIDTGIGIPADQISRIFDPFVQVHAGHARPRDGSGLGLAISRRLARLMQGDVTVESEPGRGSTFTLWLPAATPADRESPAEPTIAIAGDDRVRGLAQIGTALERERKSVVDAFAARLRTEHIAAHAESLRYAQLVDHLGAYLATVASLLMAIEDAHGHTSSLVADGAEILRVIAERHGAQRARLGWTSKALQREWQIVLEEINRVAQRPEYAVSDRARAEASVIVERFLQQAEQLSVRSLTRSLQTDS
jgi:anti-sigma regulatory factor (Ser/Thr protein kinase)